MFTEERLAYINKQIEADPELIFDLVATPNVTVEGQEVEHGFKLFGGGQRFATRIMPSDFLRGYTPEAVSGTNPGNGKQVQFSLVPRKLNPELYGPVERQLKLLSEMQQTYPFVRETAPLEDLTRLYTLRVKNLLANDSVDLISDMTCTRNFTINSDDISTRRLTAVEPNIRESIKV